MSKNEEERVLAERRRRLDAVFGDVLPSVTRDERDDGANPARSVDEDLLADRPPHHDRS